MNVPMAQKYDSSIIHDKLQVPDYKINRAQTMSGFMRLTEPAPAASKQRRVSSLIEEEPDGEGTSMDKSDVPSFLQDRSLSDLKAILAD